MHSSLSSLLKPEKHSHENDPGVLTHDWAQGELGWHSLISEEDMLIKSTYNHTLWNTECAIEHYSYWLTGTLNAILLQQEATSALTVVWTRSVDAFLGARVAIALILIYVQGKNTGNSKYLTAHCSILCGQQSTMCTHTNASFNDFNSILPHTCSIFKCLIYHQDAILKKHNAVSCMLMIR